MPEEVRNRLMVVTIRTIDSFQSGDGRMVILDAVIARNRNGGPGFFTDPHRLNVATSCAHDCFIIVIDMAILGELEGDLRSGRNDILGEFRSDQGPEFLRDLLLEYRNSNSVFEYPIQDETIPIKEPFLVRSMALVQK